MEFSVEAGPHSETLNWYVVKNASTGEIIRYCSTEWDARLRAQKLNKLYKELDRKVIKLRQKIEMEF
jgi:hypothetical protein